MAFRLKKAHIPDFGISRVQSAARAAVLAATKELVRFADKEAGIFSRRVQAQRFASFREHPLAHSTLAKKRMYRRSLRVMVSTGDYSGSIRAFPRAKRGGGLTVYIGHAANRLARDTRTGRPRAGVTANKVALWQEKGTKRLVARPHWQPGLETLRKRSPAERARILRLASATLRSRLGLES